MFYDSNDRHVDWLEEELDVQVHRNSLMRAALVAARAEIMSLSLELGADSPVVKQIDSALSK